MSSSREPRPFGALAMLIFVLFAYGVLSLASGQADAADDDRPESFLAD